MTEFSRILYRSPGTTQEQAEERVRLNYERTRARCFPRWDGEPYIQSGPCPCGCQRLTATGWYADVPDEFVRPGDFTEGP